MAHLKKKKIGTSSGSKSKAKERTKGEDWISDRFQENCNRVGERGAQKNHCSFFKKSLFI